MISKIEYVNIFNPDTHNTVKTLATFRKKIPDKININKNIKYIHQNYSSVNLLDFYLKNKGTTRGIKVVTYSNIMTKILMGIYMKRNFRIEVIKDRHIIYLNEVEDINKNEKIIYNLKNQEIFKRSLLNNNKNPRYILNKVRYGNNTILIAGRIDATINDKYINIILVKELSYRILLEIYFNGIFTNTYKVLYGILNNDNGIRYYNAIKINDMDDMLSLDLEKGIKFFNKVLHKIGTSKKHKFIVEYNASDKNILIK